MVLLFCLAGVKGMNSYAKIIGGKKKNVIGECEKMIYTFHMIECNYYDKFCNNMRKYEQASPLIGGNEHKFEF